MTPTIAAVLAAAFVWLLLPMKVNPTRDSWQSKEYWLCQALFGLAGIGFLVGIIDAANPAISILRFWLPAAVGVGVAALNLFHDPQIRPSGLFLLGVFVPMAAFAISERLTMPLMSLALLLPAILVPRSGYALDTLYTGLRDAVRLMLLILLGFIAIFPNVIIGPCRSDKCSVWGQALGPLGAGNAFGVYVAFICGISVLLAKNAQSTVLVVLASGVLVDATSSRSALLSWGLTVTAALVWRLVRSQKQIPLLTGLSISTLALIAFFALYSWRPQDFTGRANLWIVAKESFLGQPLFGLGPSFWVRQDRTSYVDSNYATHNLLLEVLVSVGLFGAIAMFASVVCLIGGSDKSLRGVTLVLTTAWLAGSVLEVSAAPGRMYLLPGVLVLLYVLGQSNGVRIENQQSNVTSYSKKTSYF
jgi:hypothetical protein